MATVTLEPEEDAALLALYEIPTGRPRSGPQRGTYVSAREVADRVSVSFAAADRVLRELVRVGFAGMAQREGLDVYWITSAGIAGVGR